MEIELSVFVRNWGGGWEEKKGILLDKGKWVLRFEVILKLQKKKRWEKSAQKGVLGAEGEL